MSRGGDEYDVVRPWPSRENDALGLDERGATRPGSGCLAIDYHAKGSEPIQVLTQLV